MDNTASSQPVKLSVLVVSYNHEKYIAEALNSVLAQQVDFLKEILVADDGSTDRTADIINQYQAEHPDQIRVLDRVSNVGITRNYQRGFAACAGQYVAVLEGDDYWLGPDRLSLLVNFLDEHPECVLVFNRIFLNNSEVPHCRPLQWDSSQPFELKTGDDLALNNFIGNFSACIFRNDAVKKLDPRIYEMKMYDWLFNLAVSRFGLIGYIPRILSVYRQHDGGTWAGLNMEQRIDNTTALIPVYDEFLGRVYSAPLNTHLRMLKFEVQSARLTQLLRKHPGNPFVVGYVVARKVIHRILRKFHTLAGW